MAIIGLLGPKHCESIPRRKPATKPEVPMFREQNAESRNRHAAEWAYGHAELVPRGIAFTLPMLNICTTLFLDRNSTDGECTWRAFALANDCTLLSDHRDLAIVGMASFRIFNISSLSSEQIRHAHL